MKMNMKKGMFALLAAAVAVLMIMPAAVSDTSEAAAGDVFKNVNFGGSGMDTFNAVIAVSDGFVAVGNSNKFDGDWAGRGLTGKGLSDGIIVKFNKDGTVAWAKNFGGSGEESFNSVIEVSDGYVVVGNAQVFDKDWAKFRVTGKGFIDAIIVKFNKDGTAAWAKNFGGSESDNFRKIIEVSGGYIAVGSSWKFDKDWATFGLTGKGESDATFVKFNADGTVAWAKNFGGSGTDYFDSVVAVSGGFVAVGASYVFDKDWIGWGFTGNGTSEAIILKFNDNGSIVWANKIGGSTLDVFWTVTETSGGYVAAGVSSKFDGDWEPFGITKKSGMDTMYVKFGTDGTILWAMNFNGSGHGYVYALVAVPGGFISAGYQEKIDMDWEEFGAIGRGNYDATLIKIKDNGTVEWAANFGGSDLDGFYGMVAIPGGMVAVGWSGPGSFGNGDWTGVTGRGGNDAVLVMFDDGTFAPVTNITGVPTSLKVGDDVILKGTVVPSGATSKTITWSVKSPGTTGATINGTVLSTTSTGTVVVTATIAGGVSPIAPYTQDFTIEITETAPGGGGGSSMLIVGIVAIIAIAAVGAFVLFRSGKLSKGK